MTRVEAVGEPDMDRVLAEIRQIIGSDPAAYAAPTAKAPQAAWPQRGRGEIPPPLPSRVNAAPIPSDTVVAVAQVQPQAPVALAASKPAFELPVQPTAFDDLSDLLEPDAAAAPATPLPVAETRLETVAARLPVQPIEPRPIVSALVTPPAPAPIIAPPVRPTPEPAMANLAPPDIVTTVRASLSDFATLKPAQASRTTPAAPAVLTVPSHVEIPQPPAPRSAANPLPASLLDLATPGLAGKPSALGDFAAGLASTAALPVPVALPASVMPVTPVTAVEAAPATLPAGLEDQLMLALRPVVRAWLEDNSARLLEAAQTAPAKNQPDRPPV